MKTKILALIVILAIAVVSCQKDEKEAVPQDVSFGIEQIDPSGLKGDFDCPVDLQGNLLVPVKAEVTIGGTTYFPEVFYLGGKLYTQAIKLAPGTYSVTKFVLRAANNAIVMATPNTGAAFAEYVTPSLPFDITVSAFKKIEIPIDVLCFMEAKYTQFGFFWFQVDEIVVREVCFFGDICILNPDAYIGSIYAQGGIMVDEVAVMRVIVKRNNVEVPNSPFSNMTTYGTAQPLCVQYPDYLNMPDVFTFELQVWVPTAAPGVFDWQTYATYTTTNGTPLTQIGTQGIVDFAIGTCSPMSTNVYSWLPAPPPPPLLGYGVVKSVALNYGDGGWAGWSIPANTVVLGGGFQLTGGPAAVSVPGTPNSVFPHYTFNPSEYGWVVRDAPDGASSGSSFVYGIYANLPVGYGIITSSVLNYGDGGWGGWSVPAGKVILGGGFYATAPVSVSCPAVPNSIWPHYTFGANEYGWVVRDYPDGQSNTITIYAIYADMPAGYEVITSPQMTFSQTGWGGWSVTSGKVIYGGGFKSDSPVRASAPGTPNSVWSHYTFGPSEYGWVLQSAGGGATTVYAIGGF